MRSPGSPTPYSSNLGRATRRRRLRDRARGRDWDDPFAFANAGPARTGLPYTVWVRHRGASGYDPHVLIYPWGYGERRHAIVVSMEEQPRVLRRPRQREIPDEALGRLVAWVCAHRGILIRYWGDADMCTSELLDGLGRDEGAVSGPV